MRVGAEVFGALKEILRKKGLTFAVGDEGGFAPDLLNNERALKLIVQAIKTSGYIPGKNVFIALDIAASEFYKNNKYYFLSKKTASSADKIIRVLDSWVKKYPIISIEDGLDEDDWENWGKMTKKMGKRISIVGDDLFVTNPSFSKRD